jgi:hypothetical protein
VRPSIAVCALLLALAGTAASAGAQLTELQPGARVRVTAPGAIAGRLDVTVISRTADTLVIASPSLASVPVPISRITSLEVSRGSSRVAGALYGAMWGGAIGVGLGLLTESSYGCSDCYYDNGSRGEWVIAGGIAYGSIGAVIGAIAGRERWESFDLARRTSVGVRGGRPTVAMRIPF